MREPSGLLVKEPEGIGGGSGQRSCVGSKEETRRIRSSVRRTGPGVAGRAGCGAEASPAGVHHTLPPQNLTTSVRESLFGVMS